MRNTLIFVGALWLIIVGWLLFGSASPNRMGPEKVLGAEPRAPSNGALLVRVQADSDEWLPASARLENNKNRRVRMNSASEKAFRVKGEKQNDKWFPVVLKPDRIALGLSVLATLATTGIAIITLCTAKTARRSANAAERSATATRMTAEGHLFFDQRQHYATKEMRDDLRRVF